jgi:hypothetical protein
MQLGENTMNKMSGREILHHLRSIDAAEHYLIERTHRELAAHQRTAAFELNLPALVLPVCAAILLAATFALVGNGYIA